jgi:hypothetical protein
MNKKAKKKRRPIRKPVSQKDKAAEKAQKKLRKPKRPKADNVMQLASRRAPVERRDRMLLVRHQGMIDFVTDPDRRTATYHYHRPDRGYQKYVNYKTFAQWASDDEWVVRRDQFWNEISVRILEQQQEQLLALQQKEAEELMELRGLIMEHLQPARKENGEVLRYPMKDQFGEDHPLANKPILPYPIRSYDKVIKAYLEVDERLMLRRGEVTARVEQVAQQPDNEGPVPVTASPLDPVTRTVKFSEQQLRMLAREVLKQGQPELAQPLAIDGDVGADDDANDETI